MAYWGFNTKGNRIAWSLVVLCIVVGTAFWVPGVLQYRQCLNAYSRCVCRSNATTGALRCLDPSNPSDGPALAVCSAALSRCRRTPVFIWAVGWLFLAGLCWVPCLYFCCCSAAPPSGNSSVMYQPDSSLQMVTPVTQAGQHYGLQPFAATGYNNYQQQQGGGYYYPSGVQQQQLGQPMPGYPVEPVGPQTGVPVHRY